MQMQRALSEAELERAYELVAQAVDRAGPARESAFLARLALALCAQLRSVDLLAEAIQAAERDLPG
jgi:hypothetical protein